MSQFFANLPAVKPGLGETAIAKALKTQYLDSRDFANQKANVPTQEPGRPQLSPRVSVEQECEHGQAATAIYYRDGFSAYQLGQDGELKIYQKWKFPNQESTRIRFQLDREDPAYLRCDLSTTSNEETVQPPLASYIKDSNQTTIMKGCGEMDHEETTTETRTYLLNHPAIPDDLSYPALKEVFELAFQYALEMQHQSFAPDKYPRHELMVDGDKVKIHFEYRPWQSQTFEMDIHGSILHQKVMTIEQSTPIKSTITQMEHVSYTRSGLKVVTTQSGAYEYPPESPMGSNPPGTPWALQREPVR